MKERPQEEGGNYHYIALLVAVVVSWGIVPAFAKLGNLPGDVTTLWVNWIALAAVALLITIQGKWQLLQKYSGKDYATMAALGLAWPLVYSVAYFEAVQTGGPALTTILNYTWPVFCLAFAFSINKAKAARASVLSVLLATAAVGVVCLLEQGSSLTLVAPAIFLGLTAAVTQGFYSAATDKWEYDPWVMTFVVEAVTVLGVTVLVVLRGSFVVPTTTTLCYLAAIGALSNGIGFWAFLAGSQESGKLGTTAKSTWLIGMCLVPFVQVLLLPILGAENISTWKWLGVALIAASFYIHKKGAERQHKEAPTI